MKKIVYLCCCLNFMIAMSVTAQNIIHEREGESPYCGWNSKILDATYPSIVLLPTPGWIYDSLYSDEFNGSFVDNLKWYIPDREFYGGNYNMGYINSVDNITIDNGKLVLNVTTNDDSIACSMGSLDTIPKFLTGSIISKNRLRYGYIETECYLPKNHKYWPCFWTTGRDPSTNEYDEVDVFERTFSGGTDYPNIIRQNCYNKKYPDHDTVFSATTQILIFPDSITGKTTVFGAEILPEEVVFYINGQVSSHLRYTDNQGLFDSINTFTCSDIEEMMKMQVRLTMNCDKRITAIPQPHEPARFGYFRYYRLERGSMETYHPTVFSPSAETTMVYPHVILGGTGCTANITTPTAVWAEQDIVLDKGFQVSAGTAFSARVINVPDAERSPLYKQNPYY